MGAGRRRLLARRGAVGAAGRRALAAGRWTVPVPGCVAVAGAARWRVPLPVAGAADRRRWPRAVPRRAAVAEAAGGCRSPAALPGRASLAQVTSSRDGTRGRVSRVVRRVPVDGAVIAGPGGGGGNGGGTGPL